MRSGDEVLFSGGTVFDGQGFLPAGTSVRVRAGNDHRSRARPRARRAGAEVVDLDGGTLLPGFIDAHAHPVFAGDQLRRCDLRRGHVRRGLPGAHRGLRPGAPGRGLDHRRRLVDGRLPGRDAHQGAAGRDRRATARSTCRTGTGTAPGSTAARWSWPGITAATPDPADGRIERDAARPAHRHAPGGRAAAGLPAAPGSHRGRLVRRRCWPPRTTCSRSASPAGRTRSSAAPWARPTRSRAYLRAGQRPGTLTRHRGRRAVVGPAPGPGPAARAARAAADRPGRPVPRHQRQDDAGRRRREPHRRHARAVPGRARLRDRGTPASTSSTRPSSRAS